MNPTKMSDFHVGALVKLGAMGGTKIGRVIGVGRPLGVSVRWPNNNVAFFSNGEWEELEILEGNDLMQDL